MIALRCVACGRVFRGDRDEPAHAFLAHSPCEWMADERASKALSDEHVRPHVSITSRAIEADLS